MALMTSFLFLFFILYFLLRLCVAESQGSGWDMHFFYILRWGYGSEVYLSVEWLLQL